MVFGGGDTFAVNLSPGRNNENNNINIKTRNITIVSNELDIRNNSNEFFISNWMVELSSVWIFKERSADIVRQLVYLMENAELKFLVTSKTKNDLGTYVYKSETKIILSKISYTYLSSGSGMSAFSAINDCAWNIICDLKKFCQKNNEFLSKLSDYIKQLTIEYFGNEGECSMLYQPLKEVLNIGGILISLENSKSELKRIVEHKGFSIKNLINTTICVNDTSFYFVKRSVELSKVEFYGYGLGKSLSDAESEACYNIFHSYLRKHYSTETFNDGGKKYMSKENTYNVSVDSDLQEDLERFIKEYNVKTAFIPKTVSSRINLIPKIQPKVSIAQMNNKTKFTMKEWCEPTMNYDCWNDSPLSNEHVYYGMNLEEVSRSIFEEESKKTLFKYVEKKRNKLPIFKEKENILKIIEDHQLVLIKASTGSGKSTQIPQFLLKDFIDKGKGGEFNCIVTQPRRLCAISLAKQVAYERYEYIGNSIGYSVRFDRVNPRPFGSILYTTVGTLLRSINFGLKGITHIIIDEIHERTLSIDFLLIIIKRLLESNSVIKIVLMSATIDTKIFENYFKNIYIYQLTVPLYFTRLLYLEEVIQKLKFCPYGFDNVQDENGKKLSFEELDNDMISKKAKYIATEIEINDTIPYNLIIEILKNMVTMHRSSGGSILVFLPGWNEIVSLKEMIKNYLDDCIFADINVIPLHSSLSLNDQSMALSKEDNEEIKIILSTNIAECSITVPDVFCVIDTGKVKKKCSRNTNFFSVLHTVWTSQDCMKQRSGRAGRTRNGYCYRLCSRSLFNRLPTKHPSGMHSESLDYIVLLIKSLGLGDPYKFLNYAIEPPSSKAIKSAEMSLKELSALDNDGNLTSIGFQMTNFSFDPAHTKSLLISVLFNVSEEMTLFMAYDSLPTPFFSKKVPKDCINAVINNHYFKKFTLLSDHYMAWNFHNLAFSDNITVSEYENECTNFFINASSSSLLFKINRQIKRKLRDSFELNNITIDDNMEMSEKYKEFILCSLLLKTHYPKIGYLIQSQSTPEKSTIALNDFEGNAIKIQSGSCLYSGIKKNCKQTLCNSTPFFLYSKKREAGNNVIGTNLTNVTPLQLLLFGCKNAYTDKDIGVELDQKMLLNINRKVASYILSLRTVIDNLLDSLCCNGKLTSSEEEIRKKLVKLIAKISAI